MSRRGIEMVYVYGVDNCLIKMADPVFVGYSFEKDIDCAAKIVAKAYPEEPGNLLVTELPLMCVCVVGVVCLNNNEACVIEYSEIDKELATKIDPTTGKLYYNTAHVCMNMLSMKFLKKFCESYLDQLP
jgi:UDP-N-acetylglucosamine/UDP-N-acetylgalactosamine diphosphorylase